MWACVGVFEGVHLSAVLISMLPGGWRKKHRVALPALLKAVCMHMELSVFSWPFCRLSELRQPLGPRGQARHMQDVHLKDELMSIACRSGVW